MWIPRKKATQEGEAYKEHAVQLSESWQIDVKI
jgi:hypothetical protein